MDLPHLGGVGVCESSCDHQMRQERYPCGKGATANCKWYEFCGRDISVRVNLPGRCVERYHRAV